MKLLKAMYYANFGIIIIETITIFLYNENKTWLWVMLLALIAQVYAVRNAIKKDSSSKENNTNDAL